MGRTKFEIATFYFDFTYDSLTHDTLLLFDSNYSGILFFWLLTAYGRSQALGCGVWVGQPEAAQPTLHTKKASHLRWRGDLSSYNYPAVCFLYRISLGAERNKRIEVAQRSISSSISTAGSISKYTHVHPTIKKERHSPWSNGESSCGRRCLIIM